MSRSSLSRAFLALVFALLTAASSSTSFAQSSPPALRLDSSGMIAAPNSPPCGFGSRTTPNTVQRESERPGATVDACGRLQLAGSISSLSPPLLDVTAMANARIDSMTVTATVFGYPEQYSSDPFYGGNLTLTVFAEVYYLNNGSNWSSGAGTGYRASARLDHVEASGETLRYVLTPPADGVLYRQTDFDAGDHSSQGEIAVEGPLVIVALAGSTQGMLMGKGRITSNDATYYGEPRFNYFNAPVGSIVPFRMRYQLQSGATFTADLFSHDFYYTGHGAIDFVDAVHPPLVALDVKGPARIPDATTVPYRAIARYATGTLVDVTAQATWSVSPSTASIASGALTVPTIAGQQTFTIHATYDEGGVHVEDDLDVVSRHDFFASDQTSWPMYQADSRHTGFLPVTPTPARFRPLWQRNFGVPLNPVTAGDNKVFCTPVTYFGANSPLEAIDASSGATLWSMNFGSVFSVNPPSYSYSNVYVQTVNNGGDTWLHCFDGATGERLFRSAHGAQWERYFAPTIQDGKVFVDGGTYGGMYAFDALTGAQLWFRSLPQYDQWTPAIGGDYAYAYVGSYSPGLYAIQRSDGQAAFMIPDLNFQWDGWSMNLAPVVGEHDDVVAIHDHRLISFDVANRRIRWQMSSAFQGQPSVTGNVIYAIDGGALTALNEQTGARIWSWTAPSGPLTNELIITSSLAFVSTGTNIYAVSLDSQSELWSNPVAGHLAIGNGALYVASSSGALSAFEIGIGPPLVAHAGNDTTLECAAAVGGTHATLNGTASEGPDLSFEWAAPGVTFDDPHSSTPTGTFPLGVNQVVLTVSRDGNTDRDTVVVTVLDRLPPSLALGFEPAVLWPPNHELVHVHVVATPTDACDPTPEVTLLSVVSSESDGGPGDPFPVDILDASIGQPDFDVWLRAQRSPSGDGRYYTFCYEVRDDAGHATQQCAPVVVPKSEGRARLEAGTPVRLIIFGDPGVSPGDIDPGSIVVSTWSADLFRAELGPGEEVDADQDGRMDRRWALVPIQDAPPASPGETLYARWRRGNDGSYAELPSSGVAGVETAGAQFEIRLAANPVRGSARLAFQIPVAGLVRLTVYDLAGRAVAKLVDGPVEAGRHEATFEPRGFVSSGLLFYRLEWEGQRRGGSFVLLR